MRSGPRDELCGFHLFKNALAANTSTSGDSTLPRQTQTPNTFCIVILAHVKFLFNLHSLLNSSLQVPGPPCTAEACLHPADPKSSRVPCDRNSKSLGTYVHVFPHLWLLSRRIARLLISLSRVALYCRFLETCQATSRVKKRLCATTLSSSNRTCQTRLAPSNCNRKQRSIATGTH